MKNKKTEIASLVVSIVLALIMFFMAIVARLPSSLFSKQFDKIDIVAVILLLLALALVISAIRRFIKKLKS